MTQEHPITPPPGLIKNWCASRIYEKQDVPLHVYVATQAARWGADQELEACCQEVHDWYGNGSRLRAARRPKPPSLKEQALEALMKADGADHPVPVLVFSLDEAAVIRRALEELDD